MNAVIDTSVFISYLVRGRGVHAWLVQLWLKQDFVLVMSPAIYAELVEVSGRPGISDEIEIISRATLLRRLKQRALWTPGMLDTSGATPDPKDDMLVSAAMETGAEYIVTWDKALLNMKAYSTTSFVDPENFVHILRERESN